MSNIEREAQAEYAAMAAEADRVIEDLAAAFSAAYVDEYGDRDAVQEMLSESDMWSDA